MILLLDTTTSTCRMWLVDNTTRHEYIWEADRTLAHGLLEFLVTHLSEHGLALAQLDGIGVLRGPGSFTGLRIGITTLNTIADSQHIPIVGTRGEAWIEDALMRLGAGENDQIVMPEYGREARITTPRK